MELEQIDGRLFDVDAGVVVLKCPSAIFFERGAQMPAQHLSGNFLPTINWSPALANLKSRSSFIVENIDVMWSFRDLMWRVHIFPLQFVTHRAIASCESVNLQLGDFGRPFEGIILDCLDALQRLYQGGGPALGLSTSNIDAKFE